jgi:hypothetical protein
MIDDGPQEAGGCEEVPPVTNASSEVYAAFRAINVRKTRR